MARMHKNVSRLPKGKQQHTAASAAKAVEEVFGFLAGRWKLMILFLLFGGKVRRFSDLWRAVPSGSPKMLTPQLRQMGRDGIVRRRVFPQRPPQIEYSFTDLGHGLLP